MSLIINNIDFDERLNAAKHKIHSNINKRMLVNRILEMYLEKGMFMWSPLKLNPPKFIPQRPSC